MAKARGELRADANSAVLVNMLLGASWYYRLMLEHTPLDTQFAQLIARTVEEGNRSDAVEWL